MLHRTIRRLTLLGAAIALFAAFAAPQANAATEVETLNPIHIAPHSVILRGSFYHEGGQGFAGFLYGPTKEYGSESEAKVVNTAPGKYQVTVRITGLDAHTTYHTMFAVYAQNKATGEYQYWYGGTRQFTTAQPLFSSELYPAQLTGGDFVTDKLAFGVEKQTFQCNNGIGFDGELTAITGSISLAPSFTGSDCWLGGVQATVTTNGCAFVFNAGTGTSGNMNLDCPSGKSLEVSSVICKFSIPSQTGVGTVEPSIYNEGVAHQQGLTFDLDVSDLDYVKTHDGLLCKFVGTGAKDDGTITGGVGVAGTFDDGEMERRVDLGYVQ